MLRGRPSTIGLLLSVALSWLSGCSPVFWNGLAQGLTARQPPGTGANKLMIFGGPGHATYLGCLNCSEYASDSVFNRYGSYGSVYSATSICNKYSEYGSPYSAYSACNPYALDPPVIVDVNGTFYGRLTVNTYNPQAMTDPRILRWIKLVVCDE